MNSLDQYLEQQKQQSNQPFVPLPNNFPSVAENHIAAKPVGPHMAAPQFTYRSNSLMKKSQEKEDNPFGEDAEVTITDAQNSPFINLQK